MRSGEGIEIGIEVKKVRFVLVLGNFWAVLRVWIGVLKWNGYLYRCIGLSFWVVFDLNLTQRMVGQRY